MEIQSCSWKIFTILCILKHNLKKKDMTVGKRLYLLKDIQESFKKFMH